MEAHVWRCVGKGKVWYEWAVTEPGAGPVHNVNGRSYWGRALMRAMRISTS